jgi:hypothetical protein
LAVTPQFTPPSPLQKMDKAELEDVWEAQVD